MASNLDFWQHRADLGPEAGTRDRIAWQLEVDTIAGFLTPGMRVLDMGCGNGYTARELLSRVEITLVGVDFSPAMLAAAGVVEPEARFLAGDVLHFSWPGAPFDLVFTQRCLVNLPTWEDQRQALRNLARLVAPGGRYLMVEASQEGLQAVNDLRACFDLAPVQPPAHNRYLRDAEIDAYAKAAPDGLTLEQVIEHSGTYYFLSRVVNAALSRGRDQEPAYDAPVNRLALHLPPLGCRGQGRTWVWRKA